jgi:hypothetical protein
LKPPEGQPAHYCGKLLMDTGIVEMLLSVRHLLAAASYLYDADCGRVGFNTTHKPAAPAKAPKKHKDRAGK